MAFLNEINTSTNEHIVPGVTDNVFKNDPTFAYMRRNNLQTFPGGSAIQENLLYGVLGGGAYAPGDTFPVSTRQVETGATFNEKYYYVPVTVNKEQVQVQNRGPEAVFRLIDVRLQVAALTMAARLAINFYNEGQGTGRTIHLNGMAEALNDGTVNAWTGNAHTTYGTLTRGGTIGTALNSPMTNPGAQVSGPITYKLMEEAYSSVVYGDEYPNLMVTSNVGMSYIKQKFHPQWRTETQDPNIGFNGLRFNQAMLIVSQYIPGAQGVNDADLGNYLSSNGEILTFFNTKYIRLWVAADPEYAFGFTGFKPAQDNTILSGQYLFSGNVTFQAPRTSRYLYDFTA